MHKLISIFSYFIFLDLLMKNFFKICLHLRDWSFGMICSEFFLSLILAIDSEKGVLNFKYWFYNKLDFFGYAIKEGGEISKIILE